MSEITYDLTIKKLVFRKTFKDIKGHVFVRENPNFILMALSNGTQILVNVKRARKITMSKEFGVLQAQQQQLQQQGNGGGCRGVKEEEDY